MILVLLATTRDLFAQQPVQLQPIFLSWKPADVAEPLVVTSEDLSENNGTFTYQTEMERGKLLNIAFNMQDIFGLGAASGKRLEVRMSGLSDLAPDCAAVASKLGLKGSTNCSTAFGPTAYNVDPKGGKSNLRCENVSRPIYETERVCDDLDLIPCGDQRIDPRERFLRRPTCSGPRRPICRNVKVLVDRVTDRVCNEDLYSVNFTVNSFKSTGAYSIDSYVTFNSVTRRTKTTLNGVIKSTGIAPVALTNAMQTVPSTSYFSLVCENNRLIGQAFNTPLHSVFYSEIINACGSEGSIYLRSNRPLLFDTGAISLTFEKPL
jgi:hypothetical protein